MLSRHSHPLVTLLVAMDALLAVAAFAAAYALRFKTDLFGPGGHQPEHYLLALPVVVAVSLGAFGLARLYRPEIGEASPTVRWSVCLKGAVLAALLVLALSAVYRRASYSRVVLVLYFALLAAGLPITRGLARRLMALLRRFGAGRHRVLVLGEGAVAKDLIESLQARPWTGIEVVGTVHIDENGRRLTGGLAPSLGGVDAVERIALEHPVREVFVALPWDRAPRFPEIERALRGLSADLHVVLDPAGMVPIRPQAGMLDDLPVLTVRAGPGYGWNRVVKRVVDIVGAAFGLVVFAPVMAALALLVRLTSPGPVLYRQIRVGWAGRPFCMYKFRTMREDAEQDGASFTVEDDPRRTPIGALLRRTSLDELPQLWNVLRGDMSLVGPRPERPEHLPKIHAYVPHYPLRLAVKVGMTGWAQINGQRGNTTFDERVQFDLYYVRNWSLTLDFEIIIRTIFGGFLRGAH